MKLASVVLLVDSDRDNREMCAAFLSSKGYVAVAAATAEEALPFAPDADIVITETRLNGDLDGLAFIAALRRNASTRHLPIVALSASVLEADRNRAFDVGANVFLRKPCMLADLLSRVRRLVRVARLRPAV
jgi:CheY-like chemotaxis protein